MTAPAEPLHLDTLATAAPGRGQRLFAAMVCAIFVATTAVLLPVAARLTGPMPGFVPAYQSALIVAYGLTTLLFLTHYRLSRSVPLLVLAAGSLYATLIVLVQLLSFPNVLAPGRILGTGPDTTTWLWTFWHLGPPLFALPYAVLEGNRRGHPSPEPPVRHRGWVAVAATLALAAAVTAASTRYVSLLPKSVEGDDYSLVTTTGIGPGVVALTCLALAVLCRTTRLRTVLQLWLAVSLALLICDNTLTLAGAARGTVGWFAGRLEALASAAILLAVYLRQANVLYGRAGLVAAERERARLELESARDNLALALDAAEMGDWEFDLVTGGSRRTLRHDQIFGYDALLPSWGKEEFLAHVVPDDRAQVERAFAAAASGRLEVECRIQRHDGAERWVVLRGRVYLDDTGTPCSAAGVVMDTTERHGIDDRLRRAERMEAIGQLTGGVAHDFNNLLTVIVGNADSLNRKAEDPARIRRTAEIIMLAARRGSEITDKLLAFSRRQMTRPETVNPNKVLQEFRPLLERGASEAVRLTLDLDAGIDPVRLDPGQLEAAVLNLVVNARDAMPNGGTITVCSRNETLSAADIADMPELQPGRYVRVAVTDDGTGMDEATAARVFEPFFTTKGVGKGTGLGLSQVYGFARQAGGHVRVRSEPGEGTTVTLLLPRSQDRLGLDRPRSDVVPLRPAIDGEVALVVEDEPSVLELAVECLGELGYRTHTATDAMQALERLKGTDRIDVLFSDIVMPGGMNGVQLAVEARRLRPDLKVLLTSGYMATAEARDIPTDVPLLPKPYDRHQLATRLRVVMGR